MRSVFLIAAILGATATAAPVFAKDKSTKEGNAPAAKEAAKPANIKDVEAVKYIEQRLVGESGQKGWKVTLKEGEGMSREFTAQLGARTETGTVNVSKSYPNQGVLRVYLKPRD